MTSKSETGHDINVANLEDLISCCTGYGAAYNPSKAGLKITALQTLQTNARNACYVTPIKNYIKASLLYKHI